MPSGSLQPTDEERELYEKYDTEKNEQNLSKAELFLVEVYNISIFSILYYNNYIGPSLIQTSSVKFQCSQRGLIYWLSSENFQKKSRPSKTYVFFRHYQILLHFHLTAVFGTCTEGHNGIEGQQRIC